jgi:hypothetical protein
MASNRRTDRERRSLLLRGLPLALALLAGVASPAERRAAVVQAYSWVSEDAGASPVEEVTTPGLEQRLFAVPHDAIVIRAEGLQATLDSFRAGLGAGKRLLASVHVPLASRGGAWKRIGAAGGQTSWRLAIVSEEASFLRPHFVGFPARDEARVVVYGGSADWPAVVVRRTRSTVGGDLWGPVVEGAVLFVEVLTASGARPTLVVDAVSNGIPRARQTEAGCYLDPTCYGAWSPIKSGIGRLYFEEGAQGYVCSGALLTDRSHTGKPYFLTARHCLSEQRAADTAIVFWNYHTSACNGLVPSLGSVPRTAGAALLATAEASDFTLLLLDGGPPPGTAFLGWTTQTLARDVPVAVIQHPAGAWKRISFGKLLDPGTNGGAGGKFWLVGLTAGAVEGGSSGSPLFSPSQQVVGQLMGGSGNGLCNDPKIIDEFGKFSVSWTEGLSTYLNR